MNELHLQQLVINLENEMDDFIKQYDGAEGYLKKIIGGTIENRYIQYAQFINIAEHNTISLMLPKYGIIEKFMQNEMNINYVRKNENQD